MLNKPRGIVTSANDEKGRDTVYALIPQGQWVAPVGRLDKASEGLLLLTNDSAWAAGNYGAGVPSRQDLSRADWIPRR